MDQKILNEKGKFHILYHQLVCTFQHLCVWQLKQHWKQHGPGN